MREANLISIISAFKTLNKDSFNAYLEYHQIKIKYDELEDLDVFVSDLKSTSKNLSLFDKYFIGYSIPQISKQFDLLRIDKETIVNIELKKSSTPKAIKYQLLRNAYYLSFLKQDAHLYTYVSDEKKLYGLDEDNFLVEVNLRELLRVLIPQEVKKLDNIDTLFNPSNYLVSPFNSTKEFMKGKYFLTNQQENIKNETLAEFAKPSYSIIAIKGKAGTGKTLLTYDIAKEVFVKKETLIIHCGMLNEGQTYLRDNYSLNIISIRDFSFQDFSKYYLIIVDEAQRISQGQLKKLLEEVKNLSINLLFSYDSQQILKKGEKLTKAGEIIETEATLKFPELTEKIRSNKEVSSFIRCLFDKKKSLEKLPYKNIELNYFTHYQTCRKYLQQLISENWKVINYTPTRFGTFPYEQHNLIDVYDNAHTVIGQEFDKVVAVIDEHFYYKAGELSTRNYHRAPYYHPTKMLFQIVSRTRIKLSVVIINNSEILDRCLEILNQ